MLSKINNVISPIPNKIRLKLDRYVNTFSKKYRIISKTYPPICKSVEAWAKTQPQDISRVVSDSISTSQIILRKPPITIESEIHPNIKRHLKGKSFKKYLVEVRNAKIIGLHGLIILPDDQYVMEVALNEPRLMSLPDYYSLHHPKLVKKRGTYYSIIQMWGGTNNYYHWFVESLKKLHLIIELLPKNTLFIVPNKLKTWQYESLEAIGINKHQLCYFKSNEFWELESLYFSPPMFWDVTPDSYEWLQQTMYKKFDVAPLNSKRSERIYISRSLANRRKIINEIEVEAVLKQYNFCKYLLEELSFRDQVTLFAKAEAVVAPHGAGLTNLMFAQSGTSVLELFEPSLKSPCFYILSDSMKHNYHYLIGEPHIDSADPNNNIYVSTSKLHQALNKMLIS